MQIMDMNDCNKKGLSCDGTLESEKEKRLQC